MSNYDFAANGWVIHDSDGFLGHVGPIWEHVEKGKLILAFQPDDRHRNKRGVVQGGMLMTLADRLLGAYARSLNDGRPQATVQLDVQFLAPARIGDLIVGRAEMVRNTRSLMFMKGELCVDDQPIVTANGLWKKLDS